MNTINQKLAQRAHERIYVRPKANDKNDEYLSFCKKFPALVHNCGLAQAVAFAKTKAPKGNQEDKTEGYLADLASVVDMGQDELEEEARKAPLSAYQNLTRRVIASAAWLQLYADAMLKEDT